MVRLFVSEGEGQHALTRRRPGPLPAQPDVFSSPWRSSIAAAGWTGFVALVGRSRPGTFLKSAAFFSAADLTWQACGIYGRHELNRGVFKLDGIEPKPGKLWERTKHWTTEDATLSGGALGLFMAFNPRALPGVYGWKRFLGAATVGCALGFKVGQPFLGGIPPQLVTLMNSADIMVRRREYDRLQQNVDAKTSLSRFGKLALVFHTHPYVQILRNPLQFGSITGMGGLPPEIHHAQHHQHQSLTSLASTLDQYTVVQVEFKQGELDGPDVEHGYRAYKNDVNLTDENMLQEWLEQLQDLKKKTNTELQYVWQHLARREHEFYQLKEEDREKDIFRREIQLLNNMASDLVTREAILGYHVADALKRFQQIEQEKSGLEVAVPPYSELQGEHSHDSKDNYGPQIVTEQVRTNWSRQKELLGRLEQSLSEYETLQFEKGSLGEVHNKQLQQNMEDMKKNVEATERLLRWFEQQVREADQQAKKET